MNNPKNRKWFIVLAALIVSLALYFVFAGEEGEVQLTSTVQKGTLDIRVMSTGELLAENSVKILGPSNMRRAGVWNTKITDLIPEGTYVDSGDYIGTLDRTDLANKLKEIGTELDKITSQFRAERLDTALTLRESRDNLINLKYGMEEKDLILQQSKYESPAVIRQAEIDKEKSQRAYDQALENYQIKKDQAEAKVSQVAATLKQQEMRYELVEKVLNEFTILAPKSGMLVYHRDWDGQKVEVGSEVSAWDPTVATLPDLNSLLSKTYINEIDISKVKKNQKVEIKIDAFADKTYSGKIIDVANVGEQLPNSEAKVFEVNILLDKVDTTLRPAMTTSNNILISEFEDVLYVPIEAIQVEDSAKFVYLKTGFGSEKKPIETGAANDNYIIIEEGLKEGENVFLSDPEKAKKTSL